MTSDAPKLASSNAAIPAAAIPAEPNDPDRLDEHEFDVALKPPDRTRPPAVCGSELTPEPVSGFFTPARNARVGAPSRVGLCCARWRALGGWTYEAACDVCLRPSIKNPPGSPRAGSKI